MTERFLAMPLISEYVRMKRDEIREYNEKLGADPEDTTYGRRLTNIGTFRAYIAAYLKNHPGVNQDTLQLVRHLEPGPHGLPIEVYCFSSDKRWAVHESLQADIFDHLLAVLSRFDLRPFQSPSGWDFSGLRSRYDRNTAAGTSPSAEKAGKGEVEPGVSGRRTLPRINSSVEMPRTGKIMPGPGLRPARKSSIGPFSAR
jgi:miniconductance mechanosensitive channel